MASAVPGSRRTRRHHQLGRSHHLLGRTSAFRVERTPALARDALEPSIFVNVQVTGSSVVVQGDSRRCCNPADW
jgi:hypothetical protein